MEGVAKIFSRNSESREDSGSSESSQHAPTPPQQHSPPLEKKVVHHEESFIPQMVKCIFEKTSEEKIRKTIHEKEQVQKYNDKMEIRHKSSNQLQQRDEMKKKIVRGSSRKGLASGIFSFFITYSGLLNRGIDAQVALSTPGNYHNQGEQPFDQGAVREAGQNFDKASSILANIDKAPEKWSDEKYDNNKTKENTKKEEKKKSQNNDVIPSRRRTNEARPLEESMGLPKEQRARRDATAISNVNNCNNKISQTYRDVMTCRDEKEIVIKQAASCRATAEADFKHKPMEIKTAACHQLLTSHPEVGAAVISNTDVESNHQNELKQEQAAKAELLSDLKLKQKANLESENELKAIQKATMLLENQLNQSQTAKTKVDNDLSQAQQQVSSLQAQLSQQQSQQQSQQFEAGGLGFGLGLLIASPFYYLGYKVLQRIKAWCHRRKQEINEEDLEARQAVSNLLETTEKALAITINVNGNANTHRQDDSRGPCLSSASSDTLEMDLNSDCFRLSDQPRMCENLVDILNEAEQEAYRNNDINNNDLRGR